MDENNPNQPLDLNKEYGANTTGKVPGFLLTLLVLTTINIVYNLYRALRELFFSAESAASIEAQFYQSIDDSGVEMSKIPEWFMDGFIQFLENYSSNAVIIRIVDIVYYVLLAVAVYLMFKLRLTGFYLYVVVNILGVLIVPFLYGFNFIGMSAMIMYAVIAAIFIALYSVNRKYLH